MSLTELVRVVLLVWWVLYIYSLKLFCQFQFFHFLQSLIKIFYIWLWQQCIQQKHLSHRVSHRCWINFMILRRFLIYWFTFLFLLILFLERLWIWFLENLGLICLNSFWSFIELWRLLLLVHQILQKKLVCHIISIPFLKVALF